MMDFIRFYYNFTYTQHYVDDCVRCAVLLYFFRCRRLWSAQYWGGGVLSRSGFGQATEGGSLSLPLRDSLPGQIPYLFVGGTAFPLRTYMLQPYPGHYLEEDRQIFNYRLSCTRHIIEHKFGILAAKFRVFRRPIIVSAN